MLPRNGSCFPLNPLLLNPFTSNRAIEVELEAKKKGMSLIVLNKGSLWQFNKGTKILLYYWPEVEKALRPGAQVLFKCRGDQKALDVACKQMEKIDAKEH